jgi:hypothetical protein
LIKFEDTPVGVAAMVINTGSRVNAASRVNKPKAKADVNTNASVNTKPDRHGPRYMAAYMRKRRAEKPQ